jgi:radical SAM protein with 4Fe4S-binding SPASM domain
MKIKDLTIPKLTAPIEIMIEAETKCNFRCNFCFNKESFARNERTDKKIGTNIIKKIINEISRLNIKIIRFTGGEPLLREDIFELLKHAKRQKLETRLNTNASLISEEMTVKFFGLLDNVLIPIESWNKKREEEITGYKNSLSKKIKAIKLLDKIKVPKIRVGTVATKENIKNFDKLASLILKLPVHEWEFYRPMNAKTKKDDLQKSDLEKLVKKIISLKKKTKKRVFIANAIPFCAIDQPEKLSSVCVGAIYEDGHSRLVVDPRGFIKPHYFIDKKLGEATEIEKAWQNPWLKKIRSLEYLPLKCQNCQYLEACRGGSRFLAKRINGDWLVSDPLFTE